MHDTWRIRIRPSIDHHILISSFFQCLQPIGKEEGSKAVGKNISEDRRPMITNYTSHSNPIHPHWTSEWTNQAPYDKKVKVLGSIKILVITLSTLGDVKIANIVSWKIVSLFSWIVPCVSKSGANYEKAIVVFVPLLLFSLLVEWPNILPLAT